MAAGHLLAATKGQRGRRYLLTGDVLTPLQIAEVYKELAGIRPAVFAAKVRAGLGADSAPDPGWPPFSAA